MLQVTPIYVGLLALLHLGLSLRVIRLRNTRKVSIGDGGDHDLKRAIRVHANFSEYVPLILGMLLILELNGIARGWLHAMGGALLGARVLHAWGLSRVHGRSVGRWIGTAVTLTLLFAAGTWCVVLGLR